MTVIIEVLAIIFAFIGFAVYLHFVAFAIAWGWQRGRAKITLNSENIVNVNIKKTNPQEQI